MSHAYIGTSGWNYRGWRGAFYPAHLAAARWLVYYSTRFNSVEVNYSFYRVPTEQQCRSWYVNTPANFRFALKAPRYLTHIKRLRDVRDAWDFYLSRVCELKDKLGPILFQFPSSFRCDDNNRKSLGVFLSSVQQSGFIARLAFEFRDNAWLDNFILGLLREHNAAFVISHSTRYPVFDAEPTADYAYFRFHGPREMCASSYSVPDLAPWAATLKALRERQIDVYAYFNNDVECHAPRNALSLRDLLDANDQLEMTMAADVYSVRRIK
jgi:uncharacterized protein YecE (DUF72 family)